MTYNILGSGSTGNSTIVFDHILIDCGLPFTKIAPYAKEIQLVAKNIAASYKSPRILDFVTELPKTISGKIRRATIRDKDTAENVTAPDEANAENAASETSEEK